MSRLIMSPQSSADLRAAMPLAFAGQRIGLMGGTFNPPHGGHATCALGDGVVDILGVLAALKELGYTGAVSIEHEPYGYDPTEEVKLSLRRVKAWWTQTGG